MDNLLNSVQRLKEGLAHHDSFGAQPDDCTVMIYADNYTLFELPYGDGETSGQFALGDLRNILTLLEQHGIAL
jgi:hypothetical protein